MIIHIHDVEKALDELARVVEPGGKLALYVTNSKSWDQKLESLLRFLLRKPLIGRRAPPPGKWSLVRDARAEALGLAVRHSGARAAA